MSELAEVVVAAIKWAEAQGLYSLSKELQNLLREIFDEEEMFLLDQTNFSSLEELASPF
jgi:hypothetical protein